jgi:hypothetical protein
MKLLIENYTIIIIWFSTMDLLFQRVADLFDRRDILAGQSRCESWRRAFEWQMLWALTGRGI